MNEKIFHFIFIVVVFILAVFCSGCATGPVVGGSEDIGALRAAYSELERRYNQLSEDHSELISRQKQFAAEQQGIISGQS